MSNTSRQLAKATHAIAKATGLRFCTKCNMSRPAEGGRIRPINNGRTRWECASCAAAKTESRYSSGHKKKKVLA